MATIRSLTITLGMLAASFVFAGCSPEDYYCDDSGCYYCDGLGCCDVEPPERSSCMCDADCGGGRSCTTLGCTLTCTSNDNCARGTVCESGFCVSPTEAVPTASIACTCAANEDCDRFEDGDDLVCQNGACVPAVVPTCGETRPCSAGQACVAGECRPTDQICRFSSECGPDRVCVDQQCTEPCSASNPCGNGYLCQDGYCQEQPGTGDCTSNAQCSTGQICIDGACWQGCDATTQCGEGRYCGPDGRCRADTRPQPFCATNADCAAGAVCADGVCRSPCETPVDCRAFDEQLTFCIERLCYTTNEGTSDCASSAECRSGQQCVDGVCR